MLKERQQIKQTKKMRQFNWSDEHKNDLLIEFEADDVTKRFVADQKWNKILLLEQNDDLKVKSHFAPRFLSTAEISQVPIFYAQRINFPYFASATGAHKMCN